MKHFSANASHYDEQAEFYDAINEAGSEEMNRVIEGVLKEFGVRKVLDFTCGTGSQLFWLAERGYEVVGVDINEKMLAVARSKGDVDVRKGDVRTTKVGEFGAVMTMFNAVGHLTVGDFEKAMRNVAANLSKGGLYVFDNFNLGFLLEGENITKLTIDCLETDVRKIQYSTIDRAGTLASYTINLVQRGEEVEKSTDVQTLQVYRMEQLREMLERSGFQVVRVSAVDGSEFVERESERMLVVARKH